MNKSEIYYLNDNDEIVEESKATKYIIREIDEKGNLVNESFGNIISDGTSAFDEFDMSDEEYEQSKKDIEEFSNYIR